MGKRRIWATVFAALLVAVLVRSSASSIVADDDADTDDDGMPDAWESAHSLNPHDPGDAWTDLDGDTVLNLFEYQLSSDPNRSSTPAVVTVSAGEDVEAAIDAATAGQLLRVQGGTYPINYKTFSPKTIMIQGGWDSRFTSRDLAATPTVFDSHSLDEVLYFVFGAGTSSVILDGLTLINGKGHFGALNMLAEETAVARWSIINCTIVHSESTGNYGGVVYIGSWDSSLSDVYIVNSIVANNSSSGIHSQTTETAVSRWKIINSDIAANSSLDADEGYGIEGVTLDDAVLNIQLKNTVLWGNQKTDLFITGYGSSTTVEAEYSDIGTVSTPGDATYTRGAGVINRDPLFVAPDGDNFALQQGSPCIDAGTNLGAPAADFEGDPRPLDGDKNDIAITDIGADEFRPWSTIGTEAYLPAVMARWSDGHALPCAPENQYCEPNDTHESAYGPVGPGWPYSAYPNDTNDYYFFVLNAPRTATIALHNYQAEGDLLLYRRTATGGKTLVAHWGRGGSEMALQVETLAAGKYYVRVYAAESDPSAGLYTLVVGY